MLLLYINFYDFKFKWTPTVGIGIYPTKTWLSQLVNFKNAIWTWGHFRRTICNKIVLNWKKMPQKRMECFRLLAWIEHQFLSGIRDSRKVGSLWGMMRGVGGVRKSIHHLHNFVLRQNRLIKKYRDWWLKDVESWYYFAKTLKQQSRLQDMI